MVAGQSLTSMDQVLPAAMTISLPLATGVVGCVPPLELDDVPPELDEVPLELDEVPPELDDVPPELDDVPPELDDVAPELDWDGAS